MLSIKQVPSPNFYARRGHKIAAIVLHSAEGTKAGLDSTCTNPRVDKPEDAVSATYAVMKDGSVHQYVQEQYAAWHCGRVNRPDLSLPWYAVPSNPNLMTIGIEFEGYSGQPLTEVQASAGIELLRGIVQRHPIPVDGNHLVGHYRLDSVNRAGCPGPAFPWQKIFDALGEEMDRKAILNDRQVVNGWTERLENGTLQLKDLSQMAKELRSVVVSLDSELSK